MQRMLAMMVAVIGGVLADAAPVAAQPCFAPVGWCRHPGVTFAITGRHFVLNGAWGGYWAPPPPVWGYGSPWYGYGAPFVVTPPIVVVRPVQFVEPMQPPLLPAPLRLPDPPAGAWANAAADRGEFVVIRPRKPGDAAPPAPAPAKRVVRAPEGPPADPKGRAAFEIAQAKESFVAGQYGRAMERLAEALKAEPTNPRPHFLLAQCRVARTEYAEAVAAIRDGLALAPDWPTKTFDLRAFYGPSAPLLDEHVAGLKAAAKADPADATLTFLLGYHLWFLGDQAEAEKLFRDAVKRVRDPSVIEAFLKAKKP